MVRKEKTGHPDYFVITIVSALSILGLLVSVRIFADLSQQQFGNSTHYLFHQLVYGFLFGGILGFAAYKISLSFLKKWSWLFVLINLVLMVLVFAPGLKVSSGGASRWINLGQFTFQPSELLKLTFIIYLSALLASKTSDQRNRGKWKITLLPFLAVLGLVVLLLRFQSDLSTLGVIAVAAVIIYFSSGTPIWHNILIILSGTAAFIVLIISSSYRIKRISVLLGLIRDPLGIGYQIKQALIAIGSGGILGVGLGMSSQSGFIPHLMSDSIFAEIGRELGLAGSLVLISLYLLLLWQGIRISKDVDGKFPQLLAIGLVSWICFQAFINIGAMIGILPLTGIPLPFISYGGSHIAVELAAVGVLLNISKIKSSKHPNI